MKRTIFLLMLGGLLTAFNIETSDFPENVKEIKGFKLRDKNISYNDFNLWVLTNRESFNQVFVSDSEVVQPDFEKDLIIAAKVETKTSMYKVQFKSLRFKKDEINLYFTVMKPRPKEVIDEEVSMISLSRELGVKKVNFYHDNVLVRSVPIVIVY
jgi:hypothetical protein